MSYTYSANFTIPSGITITGASSLNTVINLGLTAVSGFAITPVSGTTVVPQASSSNFLAGAATNGVSVTGLHDIAFINTATNSAGPLFSISSNNLVVTYDNLTANPSGNYITVGDTITLTFTTNTLLAPASAPPAATGPVLTCTYLASNLMTVSWSAVTGATGYSYAMAITAPAANAASAVAVLPSNSTSTSATFRNLVAGNTYSLVMTVATSTGSQSTPALVVTTPAVNASFPNTATSTAVSKAVPTTIRYKKIVCWGLAPQAVNFAQATTLGHRVAITLPVDLMNKFFTWSRASQEVAPTGRFTNNPVGTVAGQTDFVSELVKAFGKEYTDLDGVAAGLNFSSSALDMAGDLKRDPCVYNKATDTGLSLVTPVATGVSTTHYGANDLVMAYLMFKCFGSSAYDPTDIIYNVDDAFNMLSSQQLAEVINASLEAEDALANAAVQPNGKPVSQQLAGDNKGQVDAMFRGFLASDPLRYFLNGVQIPGLFETNFVCPPNDPSIGGNWCLTVGDKIEVPLQLVFRAPVTVMSVQDNVQNPSSATPDSTTTTIINGETATFDCTAQKAALANVVPIRLQISCGSPSVGSSTGSSSAPGAIPLTVAASSSIIFYTSLDAGVQTASTMAVAGGTGPLAYSLPATLPANFPSGVAINVNTGILTYTPTGTGPWGKWALPVTVTDSAASPATQTVYMNVSFDDGNGASNSSIFLAAAAQNAGVMTVSTAPVNGVSVNPLYAAIPSASGTIQNGQTIVYSSPPFANTKTKSGTVASSSNPMNLTAPLSADTLTFTYTPPALNSLTPISPAVLADKVAWSITSQSGRSGAASALPAGITFNGSSTLSTAMTAALSIDLENADYSPGNTAGNVAGVYKFIVTSTDKNGYVQSFGVSINISSPPPISASTPLAASGTAGLSYVNGNTLTYTIASSPADVITLIDSSSLGGAGNYVWKLTPVTSLNLAAANLALVPGSSTGATPVGNHAVLTVTPSGAIAGAYPYLISALDGNNVVQTIFFTINMV